MSEYTGLLIVSVVLVWGQLIGVLTALVMRRFCNPWVGRHRRAEDR